MPFVCSSVYCTEFCYKKTPLNHIDVLKMSLIKKSAQWKWNRQLKCITEELLWSSFVGRFPFVAINFIKIALVLNWSLTFTGLLKPNPVRKWLKRNTNNVKEYVQPHPREKSIKSSIQSKETTINFICYTLL